MAQEPLAGITLPGVHAYAEKSIAAGSTLHVRVSSDVPYTLTVVRLGSSLDGPGADDVALFPEETLDTGPQPITPGAYVHVDNALPADASLEALSLECWVRPWTFARWQGVMTQHSFPDHCGFGLFLDPKGYVHLYLGDGGPHDSARVLRSAQPLPVYAWSHLVGRWDGATASLWVDGVEVASMPLEGPVRPGPAPLRLAAYGDRGFTNWLLDGDLAMPVLYGRALSPEDIEGRFADQGLNPPDLQDVLGCWPLTEERGSHLQDISGHERHGEIINGATWMIGGPSFNGELVPRFGYYEPARDKRRGHGLRFASDALYDCGWQVTWSKQLPSDLAPGIYVCRIRHGDHHQFLYDVTFVVTRAPEKPRAPILVLCSTNTWLAYNATPFAPNDPNERPDQYWDIVGKSDRPSSAPKFDFRPRADIPPPTDAPKYNFYRNHRFGQPTYKVGLNLPWPVAAPYVLFSEPHFGYSHLTRAERFLHRWLEEQGYAFDVLTDLDLHQDPTALDGYEVVIINGHSEYWSVPAYEALESYLRLGGRNITLSGNTMCWRVSFDEDLTAMECRKAKATGEKAGGRDFASFGECYHSDDGRRGGLMRDCGYPAWSVLGLESAGFWEYQDLYPYVCENPDHPFFNHPTPLGLVQGQAFAPNAVGHEWDIRVALPQQGNLPYGCDKVEVLAYTESPARNVTYWDYFMRRIQPGDGQRVDGHRISELLYWKRPMGGEVFAAGSIAAGMALKGTDGRWGTLLSNVLWHFGVRRPSDEPVA